MNLVKNAVPTGKKLEQMKDDFTLVGKEMGMKDTPKMAMTIQHIATFLDAASSEKFTQDIIQHLQESEETVCMNINEHSVISMFITA